jgi:hypothetical protein
LLSEPFNYNMTVCSLNARLQATSPVCKKWKKDLRSRPIARG